MQTFLDQVAQLLGSFVPNLLGAIAILVIGWLVALILAAIARGVFRRTNIDNRIARWVVGDEKVDEFNVERWISRVVY